MNYSALYCVQHSPKLIKSWVMQKKEKDPSVDVSPLIREESAVAQGIK